MASGNGNQQLGAALGGLLGLFNPSGGEKAYQEGQQRGYTIDRAMQEAAKSRNERLISDQRVEQRNKLATVIPPDGSHGQPGQDILGDVYGPAAALARSVILSNENVNLNTLGDLQKPGALEAFRQGQRILGDDVDSADIQAANRAQSFIGGKQYDPVEIGNGVIRPAGVTLGDPGFTAMPTPQAAASIAAGALRAGAYANRQGVLNDKTRTDAGGKTANGKPAKPPTTAHVEGQELARARAALQNGADPAKVAQRLTERGFPGLAKKVYVPPAPDLGE